MHELVILIAKYFIIIPVIAVVYLLAVTPKEQRLRMAVLLGLGGVLSVLFAKIASHMYYDPRPFVSDNVTPYFAHGADNGFPSDHTLLAALLAYWAVLRHKTIGGILLAVALLIGGSRVIAHVHHLNDIIGSLLIAALGLLVAYGIVRIVWRSAQSKPA